ncbi:MAG: DUF4157 domain-containing protein [Acidobacteriota bacterium]
MRARLLQRKCACGSPSGITGQCAECSGKRLTMRRPANIQPEAPAVSPVAHKVPGSSNQSPDLETRAFPQSLDQRQVRSTSDNLKLGAADNSLERQADVMADRVMRMPAGAVPASFSPATGDATTESLLPAEINEQINQATSGGESLDRSEQEFFAPKFGHDFSKVRVHRDAATASLAGRLNAEAFTVGAHIFFNSGAYQPRSEAGRRLLAHELAHVVQQERGLVSRHVQRASIPYRQVTWADFKGNAPSGTTFSAETSSGFLIPAWRPKVDVTDTKEPCEVDKKKSTKHTVTLSVDPAVFDAIQATMDQGKSWVLSKYKDPDKHCPTVTTDCETEIGKQAADASKDCKQVIKPCQDAFDSGSTRYTQKFNDDEVEVTSKAECSTKLVSGCEKAFAKNQLFELSEKCSGSVVVKATSKAGCSDKKFKENCLTYYKDWSARLLKHEQGHFDISNILANKARADLKAKATKYTATATECGKSQANKEAVKQFDALNGTTELPQRGQDWVDLKDTAHKDYDDQTDHGCKQPEQATWDKDIAAGLKNYDLNKPAAPPQTNPAQPNPIPANPGAAATDSKVEQKGRVVEATASGSDEAQKR